MLNELYSLAQVLKQTNISLTSWHPKFLALPNNPNIYKITIGNNPSESLIKRITPLSSENIQGLRKYSKSNGWDFPCLNLNPVIVVSKTNPSSADKGNSFEREFCRSSLGNEADSISEKKLSGEFIKALSLTPLSPEYVWAKREELSEEIRKKTDIAVTNCIHKAAQELRELLPADEADCRYLLALIDRLALVSASDFWQGLIEYITARLQENPHQWEELKPLLLSTSNALVILEYDAQEPDQPYSRIAHHETHARINELLMTKAGVASCSDLRQPDAFGGTTANADDKLWGIILPGLGNIKGRSMVAGSPCQYRYGTIESQSFPIGKGSREITKSALEWLSSAENEHKTWGNLAPDHKELLFAYPSQLGERPPGCIELFGESNADENEVDFKTAASQVFSSLYKIEPNLSQLKIHVFALRKMDPARTKVIYNRTVEADHLKRKVEDWVNASQNIPYMKFRSWGQEKGRIVPIEPAIPTPFQLSQCLRRIWGQGGKINGLAAESSRTIGIDILLLENDVSGILRHTFHLFLQRSFNYFLAVGGANNRKLVLTTEDQDKNLKYMPSILGLFLYKLEHRMEDYMKSGPFLLGQLLALADQLHVLYSQEVRKEMPSQLVGNALMATASETPVRCFEVLGQRLPPYLNWAKVYQGEKKGLALYFRKKMSEAADELAQLELPTRFNEKEKASLLLGYLASTSQPNKEQNND